MSEKKGKRGFYKPRSIRMSDEVWEELFENWKKSGLSWNLFLIEINKLIKK